MKKQQSEEIVLLLKGRQKILLVSDSGLPIVSTPGNILVKTLKENQLEYTAANWDNCKDLSAN